MDAGLELDFNIQVQLYPQLQTVLIHGVFSTAVFRVDGLRGLERLRGWCAPPWDFPSEHASVGDGAIHGLRWWFYPLKRLGLGDVSWVGVLEPLLLLLLLSRLLLPLGYLLLLLLWFVAFVDRGHGLGRCISSLGLALGALPLSLVLSSPPA